MKFLSSATRALRTVCALVAVVQVFGARPVAGQNPQAELWQARNGTPATPRNPVEWVRGNASPANSHYVEGFSVPYRLVLSGLSLGSHKVVIGWDTKQSAKHAFDYLTHY